MDQVLEAGSGYVDEYKAAFDVLPPLTSLQMQKVSDLKDGKVNFPARVGDILVGPGVHLRPQGSSLGPAGQLACPAQPRASGVWRGTLEGQTPSAAANRAAPILLGALALDACGVLANTALSGSSLHFLPVALLEEVERQSKLAAAKELSQGEIQGQIKVFALAGRVGQVLSHSAELFLYGDGPGKFEALLRLQPLKHVTREAHFQVAREGPLGATQEVWSEVAMVELPRLFQLSITHATSAVGIPKQQFLVEEEDEILVINAWQRNDCEDSVSNTSAVSLEQLLWCETLRALAETPPCAEESVPAARVSLADEGVTTYEELLDSPAEEGAGVPREDAPRLASLAFLRQYVRRPVLEEELLPRLLPNGRGVVRVFSAQLDEREGASPLKGLRPPKPKSLDDLFSETPDFRKPSHYATGNDENDPDGDPLISYDLTSVLLLCETSGFLLAFHCLQVKDPST